MWGHLLGTKGHTVIRYSAFPVGCSGRLFPNRLTHELRFAIKLSVMGVSARSGSVNQFFWPKNSGELRVAVFSTKNCPHHFACFIRVLSLFIVVAYRVTNLVRLRGGTFVLLCRSLESVMSTRERVAPVCTNSAYQGFSD